MRQVPHDCTIKSGNAESFGETRQQDDYWTKLIRRSVEFPSATKECIPWRVDGHSNGETCRIEKKKIQKTPTNLRLRLGITKENLLPKTVKLVCNPCTRSQFFSWQGKSKGYRSDMGPLSPNIAEHTPLYGNRLLHSQEKSMEDNLAILWKTWAWIWLSGDECSWIPLFEQRLISEKTMTRIYNTRRTISEFVGLKTIEFEETAWRSTSLLCERAYQITNAKVYIFSVSALCGRDGRWSKRSLEE